MSICEKFHKYLDLNFLRDELTPFCCWPITSCLHSKVMMYILFTGIYIFLRGIAPVRPIINGWSLESHLTSLFHQGITLPLFLGQLLNGYSTESVIYSSTFAYLFTGFIECKRLWNRARMGEAVAHFLHHLAGIFLIFFMIISPDLTLQWWGAVCTATLEIGGLGLGMFDLYPTQRIKQIRILLYGSSRLCVMWALYHIFILLPREHFTCVCVLSTMLIIHNGIVFIRLVHDSY